MASTITKSVTAHHPFFSCNPDRTPLFSVNPGVSEIDALNMVSVLLLQAQVAHSLSEEEPSWAADCLVGLANAVVDALIDGLAKKGGAQ